MEISQNRILSIDVFRAVTMLLMIFVNDFIYLTDVPYWLKHAKFNDDFLGFSDVIFPAFLFIVGMSIPYAFRSRSSENVSKSALVKHIISRTAILLLMGIYTVNIPEINEASTGMSKRLFMAIVGVAFFLVWNDYPKVASRKSAILYKVLKALGIAILALLAVIFRGGSDGTSYMSVGWWGILGIIGWTYLASSLIYIWGNKRELVLYIALIFFILLNFAQHLHLIQHIMPMWLFKAIPINSACMTFTLVGILSSLLLENMKGDGQIARIPFVYAGVGVIFLLLGFYLHNYFIISKLQGTPTWVFICCGIALIVFAVIFTIVDLYKKASWFNIIKAAGTSSLTCYIAPCILDMPIKGFLAEGMTGLVKSMLYAFFVITVVHILGKYNIKLKV